ncbi:MAG: cysteine desulfurase [Chlorobiaceae bacterium]|nr:cysteine desulfurase [Chlorobiaceae bacterium]NTW75079.1 cysteine desulfurase [Chlorobiaceae bacterium]
MPGTNEHHIPGQSIPELLNPTFIARLASQLFNELPEAGRVPRSEPDLQAAPDSAASAALEHAAPAGNGPAFAHQSFEADLPRFEPDVPPATDGSRFYFLPDANARQEEPLEAHAERLTEQQAYAGSEGGPERFEERLISLDFLRQGGFLPGLAIPGFGQGGCIVEELWRKSVGSPEPLPAGVAALKHGPEAYYFLNAPDLPPSPVAGTEIFDVASVRRDFPVLNQQVHGKPLVWLDNAATTQKPLSVIEAISTFYATDNSNIHRGAHTLAARATDAYEGAREKIRQFIGAGSTSEIVYVRGTTEAINLVAQTWGRKFIQPGDEILLSILEHHANIVPWQMLAQEKGAVIRVVPVDERGEIILEEYTRLLGPRTRLVSLTQASNGLGTILPVREMIRLARRYDTRVLVDGAQSVAHLPVNVQDLDADFFVFSGHKIFAPTGIGVLYARRELLELMPPWQGGGNMIRDVRFEQTLYNEPPAKFEAGTPSIADAVGLGAAIDYVRKIGLENIARYEHELTRYATDRLAAIPGLRLIGTAREKVGVLSFVLDRVPNDEVGRILDREGIAVRTGHHCTQPSLRRFGVEGTVRPSLAFYNTTHEIDRLADTVTSIRRG